MHKLVLLRHGQSTWNKLNKFSGWANIPLTKLGRKEAKDSGRKLSKYHFDLVFTSVQKRGVQTTNIALAHIHSKPKVIKAWQLNERHYGALQGLNKSEMAKKFGEAQVKIWRRSYDVPPPKLKSSDKRFKAQLKIYKMVPRNRQPLSECLKDCVKRVMPYWNSEILPSIKKGKKVLISAHGNSLRALVKHLDNISDKKIIDLNIPTGIPLVYELNDKFKPIRHYYLASKKELRAATNKILSQGKAK